VEVIERHLVGDIEEDGKAAGEADRKASGVDGRVGFLAEEAAYSRFEVVQEHADTPLLSFAKAKSMPAPDSLDHS
jgi:hypothetical protein